MPDSKKHCIKIEYSIIIADYLGRSSSFILFLITSTDAFTTYEMVKSSRIAPTCVINCFPLSVRRVFSMLCGTSSTVFDLSVHYTNTYYISLTDLDSFTSTAFATYSAPTSPNGFKARLANKFMNSYYTP